MFSDMQVKFIYEDVHLHMHRGKQTTWSKCNCFQWYDSVVCGSVPLLKMLWKDWSVHACD